MKESWQHRRSGKELTNGDFLDIRTVYERDRARIIHSASFRRLQNKTQLFNLHESDYSRTRLTHTLEVAQIATGLVQTLQCKYDPERRQYRGTLSNLVSNPHLQASDDFRRLVTEYLPSTYLIESICLAHDIGHSPYGHSGEYALNKCMFEHGGFEGNAQSLRIVTKIESYSQNLGLDLTRRTLLGIIKYPTMIQKTQYKLTDEEKIFIDNYAPGKGIYQDDAGVFEWILRPLSPSDRELFTSVKEEKGRKVTIYKSFDCSIMELADDIAYSVADLEDAVKFRVVNQENWQEFFSTLDEDAKDAFKDIYEKGMVLGESFEGDLISNMFSSNSTIRKQTFAKLIQFFVTHVYVEKQGKFEEPLLDLNARLPDSIMSIIKTFKTFSFIYVIQTQTIRGVNNKGQRMIKKIFTDILHQPSLLGRRKYAIYKTLESDEERYRYICDYVSGMTNDAVNVFYDKYIA